MSNKYFGDQAKKYSEFANTDFSWLYVEKPLLKSIIGSDNANRTALDLGCGAGRSITLLNECRYKNQNITGVDISEDLLAITKNDFPEVNLINSNIADVELSSAGFDLILSVMVFHYLNLEQLNKVISDCSSWLKEGGKLVFVTLHPFRYAQSDFENYFDQGAKEEKTPWNTNIEYFHKTFSTYINSLTKNNFIISEVVEPTATLESKNIDEDLWKKYSNPTRLLVIADKI